MTREAPPTEIETDLPAPLPPAAAKAEDLDAIRKSLEDAAAVSGGLWISYLFVLFYMAIAAGAVSHIDLFLENPVKLPFLNIELPIKAFFLLAPLIFLACHIYTLTYFVILSDKANAYHQELCRQIVCDDAAPSSAVSRRARELRNKLRRQLPSNIFVQFLAGPDDIRASALGVLLKVIAWTSLVIAPVLLLLLMQMQFLPYHSSIITWTARLALLVDILAIWWLWEAILRGRGDSRRQRSWTSSAITGFGGALSLLAILFSVSVATFPGERLDNLFSLRWLSSLDKNKKPVRVSLHDYLFSGPINPTTRHRSRFFSGTLVLPAFKIEDQLKIDDLGKHAPFTYVFRARGRDFRGAVFDLSNLSHVDFEGATLQDASFALAALKNASFLCARLQNASLAHAALQGAWFYGAQMQGATLSNALGQGAMFDGTQLEAADLDNAELQGASFTSTELAAAKLSGAHLEGASFEEAGLDADCIDRDMRDKLDQKGADLLAAALDGAFLDGTTFVGAQLQGANLQGAKVDGTDFSKAFLWRTNLEGVTRADTPVKIDEARWTSQRGDNSTLGWTSEAFAALADRIAAKTPARVQLSEGEDSWEQRLAALRCNSADLSPCDTREPSANSVALRADWEKDTKDVTAYEAALGATFRGLVCSDDPDAIFVLRGLLGTDRLADAGASARQLVEDIQSDPPKCPVARILLEYDKTNLVRFKTKLAARLDHKP